MSIVCKQGISADERRLLDVVALCQHGGSLEALALLRAMVRPVTAMAAVDSANRVAAVLAAADLKLAAPACGTTRYAFVPDGAIAQDDRQAIRWLH